jgi:hypothetical protein
LEDVNSPTDLFVFGDDETQWGFAAAYGTGKSANVTEMLIRVGKVYAPADTLTIELRECPGYLEPGPIITGGTSDPVNGPDLPDSMIDQDFVRFVFPDKPLVSRFDLACFSITRSGPPDPTNYYRLCVRPEAGPYTWHQTFDGRWPNGNDAYVSRQLYGISTEG